MHKPPLVIIPLGKPGSGKETAQKIITNLINETAKDNCFLSDTGALFRSSISSSPSAPIIFNDHNLMIMEERQTAGLLQPAALAVGMWLPHFVRNYKGEPFIIIDGSPRRWSEAPILLEFLEENYGATVRFLYIDATDENCLKRMAERNRPDSDTDEKRKTRLEQFYKLNYPTILELEKDTERFYKKTNNAGFEEFGDEVKNFYNSVTNL